jgi:hypothetical protein
MADAHGSGPCVRKDVGVQLPPRPLHSRIYTQLCGLGSRAVFRRHLLKNPDEIADQGRVTTEPSSAEVKLAAVLTGVAAGFGVLVVLLGVRLFMADDFLMFVLPMIGAFLVVAGLYISTGAVATAIGLRRGRRGVRLHTALVGGCLAVSGLFVMAASLPAGTLVAGYGGTLLYLMTTEGAARDLGPWFDHLRQPAPWGSRPGTKLWSKEPAQQGPWAPDPTTLPWFTWKNHSGPRSPWWQTWQAGLRQGMPLWELVLLVLAFLVFLVGLVAVPFAIAGSHRFGTLRLEGGTAAWLLLLIPAAIGIVVFLEQRMRRRLAGRR